MIYSYHMILKKIMGLDISSSTVGLCILTYHDGYIELTHVEYFKPPKKGHIFERLSALKTYIQDFIEKWKPDEVAIEDILMGFHGKMTTVNTIALLAIFNRTVGLAIFECAGLVPHMYSPMEVRRTIVINDHIPTKEEVPSFLEQHLLISFPWQKKINRRTKKEEIIIENYDMSDSIATALCHILCGGVQKQIIKKSRRAIKKTTKSKVTHRKEHLP